MYENLNVFDKKIARFGDRVSLLAGLEISGKLSPEETYEEIKKLYKELKGTYKKMDQETK
jgi:hypothetical protein